MNVVVVYESIYGNTRAVAEAVADGLGGADVMPVHAAADAALDADLLVVGGPTHMHGLTTTRSRRMAADAVHEDGGAHVEPGATEEPGLRAWLRDLPHRDGADAAAFDTRLDKSPWLTGIASRGIDEAPAGSGLRSAEHRELPRRGLRRAPRGPRAGTGTSLGSELARSLTAAAW
jgi:hypothetical protein